MTQADGFDQIGIDEEVILENPKTPKPLTLYTHPQTLTILLVNLMKKKLSAILNATGKHWLSSAD